MGGFGVSVGRIVGVGVGLRVLVAVGLSVAVGEGVIVGVGVEVGVLSGCEVWQATGRARKITVTTSCQPRALILKLALNHCPHLGPSLS